MEILRVTLQAGVSQSFHKSGKYFEVMKAAAPFDVSFTDRAIGVYPCRGLEAGIFSELPFQRLEVTSATQQTVVLLIADMRAGFRNQLNSLDKEITERKGYCSIGVNPVAGQWSAVGFKPNSGNAIKLSEFTLTQTTTFYVFKGVGDGSVLSGAPIRVMPKNQEYPISVLVRGSTVTNQWAPTPGEIPGASLDAVWNTFSGVTQGFEIIIRGNERLYFVHSAMNTGILGSCKIEEIN